MVLRPFQVLMERQLVSVEEMIPSVSVPDPPVRALHAQSHPMKRPRNLASRRFPTPTRRPVTVVEVPRNVQ